ncbi:MAG TPA: hypothetical protein VLA54_14180 [Acidimicrobiia bacterium]|nr:hypothetical protein [Acidimicrobiia bacterium]
MPVEELNRPAVDDTYGHADGRVTTENPIDGRLEMGAIDQGNRVSCWFISLLRCACDHSAHLHDI